METRKLHDFEVTRVAAQALCKRETVRKFLNHPDRMKPATRARVEAALRALGLLNTPDGTVPNHLDHGEAHSAPDRDRSQANEVEP